MGVIMEYTHHEKAVQLLRDYARLKGVYKRRKVRRQRGHQTRWARGTPVFSVEAISLANEWLHTMDFVWLREGRINSDGFLRMGTTRVLGLRDLRVAFPHLSYEELAEVYPCIPK